MNNLTFAAKAMDKLNTPKEVVIVVRVRGDSKTMKQLEAVGKTDLEEYFVPKALCLESGDGVEVSFVYP